MKRVGSLHYKRWYDHDPLISMAVSLLQNTDQANQQEITAYILNEIRDYPSLFEQTIFQRIHNCIFLIFHRRQKMDHSVWYLLEVLKLLSYEQQRTVSLKIINYIYEKENLERFIFEENIGLTEENSLYSTP